jgi:hypothetical protein
VAPAGRWPSVDADLSIVDGGAVGEIVGTCSFKDLSGSNWDAKAMLRFAIQWEFSWCRLCRKIVPGPQSQSLNLELAPPVDVADSVEKTETTWEFFFHLVRPFLIQRMEAGMA